MSVTGVWLVGAVPDREASALAPRFSDASGASGPARSAALAADLDWWTAVGEREPFFEEVPGASSPRATDAAYRFASLVDAATPATEPTETVWDACVDLMTDQGEDGMLVAVARKASPVAALYYALGPEGTSSLPGRFGHFLLSHGEVEARLADVEHALRPTGDRRARALRRIGTWMECMGDAPGFDAEELLDGPPRVLRRAAASGHGVAAFTRWY
jgi:hypothetical protein